MKLHIGSRSLSVLLATGTLLVALQLTSCSDTITTPAEQPGTAAPEPAPRPTTPEATPSATPDFALAQGNYGGENIEMKVSDLAVNFQFGCADGTISGKLEPDSQGAFEKVGTFRSTSGPVPQGGYPVFSARYAGNVNRGFVELTATYTDAEGNPQSIARSAQLGEEARFTIICATSTGGGTLQ